MGGMGPGASAESAGSEKVFEQMGYVDYGNVDWGSAQERCYEKNKARFKTPEYRTFTAAVLLSEDFAAKVVVPEAELQRAYEANKERLYEKLLYTAAGCGHLCLMSSLVVFPQRAGHSLTVVCATSVDKIDHFKHYAL